MSSLGLIVLKNWEPLKCFVLFVCLFVAGE